MNVELGAACSNPHQEPPQTFIARKVFNQQTEIGWKPYRIGVNPQFMPSAMGCGSTFVRFITLAEAARGYNLQ
jgi:hypothetical protein